jgi:hypothetical protein
MRQPSPRCLQGGPAGQNKNKSNNSNINNSNSSGGSKQQQLLLSLLLLLLLMMMRMVTSGMPPADTSAFRRDTAVRQASELLLFRCCSPSFTTCFTFQTLQRPQTPSAPLGARKYFGSVWHYWPALFHQNHDTNRKINNFHQFF